MTLLDPSAATTTGEPDAAGHRARAVRSRAAFLREVADGVEPLLATSMRRRASELELEAWVLDLRAGDPAPGRTAALP